MKQYILKNSIKIKNCKLKILVVCTLLFLQSQVVIVYAEVPAISPTPKPVEYVLPYPGLLPDHPLYFFRAVRDTVQDIFTSSPLKKAEFHLLQADKRVSASVLLAGKKDTLELGAATAMESQTHFEKALEALENAKKEGMEINDLSKKLVLANQKHQETFALLVKVGGEHTDEYVKAADKARELGKKAKQLLPSK